MCQVAVLRTSRRFCRNHCSAMGMDFDRLPYRTAVSRMIGCCHGNDRFRAGKLIRPNGKAFIYNYGRRIVRRISYRLTYSLPCFVAHGSNSTGNRIVLIIRHGHRNVRKRLVLPCPQRLGAYCFQFDPGRMVFNHNSRRAHVCSHFHVCRFIPVPVCTGNRNRPFKIRINGDHCLAAQNRRRLLLRRTAIRRHSIFYYIRPAAFFRYRHGDTQAFFSNQPLPQRLWRIAVFQVTDNRSRIVRPLRPIFLITDSVGQNFLYRFSLALRILIPPLKSIA